MTRDYLAEARQAYDRAVTAADIKSIAILDGVLLTTGPMVFFKQAEVAIMLHNAERDAETDRLNEGLLEAQQAAVENQKKLLALAAEESDRAAAFRGDPVPVRERIDPEASKQPEDEDEGGH